MTATLQNAPPARPRRMVCPRCTAPMRELSLPTHRPVPITVEHCPGCRLVWFDELESVQLDGLGWVRLLREMEDGGRRPLADAAVARPACPACAAPLNRVQNRTRYGLFAALECPQRHGHLHSHSGLLAERGLVRPLGVAERRALAQEKHRLHCFNCGAAAAASDDSCSYCRTALVVLDLPRLAHSLRLRNDAMAPSPTTLGRHAVWSCRGCGAALDPGRETSCSHCSHLVVAQELPDIHPLLEAAEAEQAAAAAAEAQRRARFPSTRQPRTAAAPPRALTSRPPRASRVRSLMLAGWLPLWLLLAAACGLVAPAIFDLPWPARPPAEALRAQAVGEDPRALWGWAEAWRLLQPDDRKGLRVLRLALFDVYTRQLTGERPPAKATVGGLLDGSAMQASTRPLAPDLGRWDRALGRQLRLLPPAGDAPLPEEALRPGSRLQQQAPGVWLDDTRADGLWAPQVENSGPGPLRITRLALKVMVAGPNGVGWRCEPARGAAPVLPAGARLQLLCRTTVLVRLQEDLWSAALRRLDSDAPPTLEWRDEGMAMAGAWNQAVDLLIADAAGSSVPLDRFLRRHTELRRGLPPVASAAAQPRASLLAPVRALATTERWQAMPTAQRQALALAALLLAFVGYSAVARRHGERRARWALLLVAVPLAWLAGRGEGAASVLLVGMYLSLAVIAAFGLGFAFRLYRDTVFRRFD